MFCPNTSSSSSSAAMTSLPRSLPIAISPGRSALSSSLSSRSSSSSSSSTYSASSRGASYAKLDKSCAFPCWPNGSSLSPARAYDDAPSSYVSDADLLLELCDGPSHAAADLPDFLDFHPDFHPDFQPQLSTSFFDRAAMLRAARPSQTLDRGRKGDRRHRSRKARAGSKAEAMTPIAEAAE
ncbi:MAG: hypothetical protein M1832_003631 [Thelocarpon impressellum]|nr:MAG: hypothetical protein M1832_003631 [Thelocarpon impressellum]